MTFIISLKYLRYFNINLARLSLGFMFLVVSKLTLSAAIETPEFDIDPFPLQPSSSGSLYLDVTETGSCDLTAIILRRLLIDQVNLLIKVSMEFQQFSGTFCFPPDNFRVLITDNLPDSGTYQVLVYKEGFTTSLFNEMNLTGTFNLTIAEPNQSFHHENPTNNSTVSGIGEISGWVCDANKVEAQIDDNNLFPVIYGTPMEDSETVCGDLNNGYTFPINWDHLGLGHHRLKIFVDDTQTTEVAFNVSAIEPVSYDSTTRIVTIPRVIVDKNKAYNNIDLLLGIDGTWDILTIEPEPEPE